MWEGHTSRPQRDGAGAALWCCVLTGVASVLPGSSGTESTAIIFMSLRRSDCTHTSGPATMAVTNMIKHDRIGHHGADEHGGGRGGAEKDRV